MLTYSATIALHEDNGRQHEPELSLQRLIHALKHNELLAGVFTVAIGQGIDTETGDTEPVLVVQGFSEDTDHVFEVIAHFASVLGQRAIGWFTSENSYALVP